MPTHSLRIHHTREEIVDRFRTAGYHIEPATHWNGLRRRTREISW